MIGLGSNRLTVCRRGGMSVTQAGRGGMEWLAGGRLPSWATPYSAQATAALKAQFPTQWPTIRDYGFAHPEIVGYMNAYAPEDAKIAYSLVEGIGWRILKGDGTAWLDTGYRGNVNTNIEADYIDYDGAGTSSIYAAMFGALNNNNRFGLSTYPTYNTGYFIYGTTRYEGHIIYGGRNSIKLEGNQYIANGTSQTISRTGLDVSTDFALFTWRDGNVVYTLSKSGFRKFRLYESEDKRYLIPFKLGEARSADQVYPSSKGAQAVGTLGMIDLITGKFHPNAASSGAFSEVISETPAS